MSLRQSVIPESVRLASFNIHGGKSAKSVSDLVSTATVIAAVMLPENSPVTDQVEVDIRAGRYPDYRRAIAGLNEVRPNIPGDQAIVLSQLLNRETWSSAYMPAEERWFRPNIGNAILTTTALAPIVTRPLPNTRGKGYRNYSTTKFSLRQIPVALLVTHADSREDRDEHLRILTESFLKLPSPSILMGDLNAPLTHPTLAALLEAGVTNALAEADGLEAYPEHIDHIFVRGLEVTDAAIVANDASDHPLVWADVRLPEFDRGDAAEESGDPDGTAEAGPGDAAGCEDAAE